MLRMNELFSGIGSQTKALQRASVDHVITGISEIDEPAIRSYTAIYGDTYNYGDISKVDSLKQADFWTYSFPCTHLAVSGARHFEKKRADGRQREGIEFFAKFLNADCDKIAIENPVGIIAGEYIPKWFPDLASKYGFPVKPTQIIQPYEFGEPHKKTTCLWLKGLPMLEPTKIVEPELESYICKNGKKVTFSKDFNKTGKERAKNRSKTYLGVAKAMAKQWGDAL